MKILHTADWHLGKYLNNVSLLDDQRYILQQLLKLVEKEKPDVVVLAGDIYDRSVPSGEAVNLFDDVVHEIVFEQDIPLITIAGNHDSPERTQVYSGLLRKQHLFMSGKLRWPIEPVVLEDEHGPVYFYPVPYTEPEQLRFLLEDEDIRTHDDTQRVITDHIRENHPVGERSVVIGHAFVAGAESSDSERVLSVGGAETVSTRYFKDFTYTAQGHLHGPQRFLDGRLQYCGSPLKYSFSEADHQKGVVMVQIDGFGMVTTKRMPLEPKRDLRRIEGRIDDGAFVWADKQDPPGDEDFLEVRLQNQEQVFNAMGIVQRRYPNALKLRWPEREMGDSEKGFTSESLDELQPVELFERFYRNFEGQDLEEKYREVLIEAVESVHKEQEGDR